MASNKQPPLESEPVAVNVPIEDLEYDSEETIIEEHISKYRPRVVATTSMVGPRSSRKAYVMQSQTDWLPENWRKEVIQRTSGLSKGKSDSYYISPIGERLRSKKEVERYLKEQVKAETTSQAIKPVKYTTTKKRRGRPRKYGAFSHSTPAPSPLNQTLNVGDEPIQASGGAK